MDEETKRLTDEMRSLLVFLKGIQTVKGDAVASNTVNSIDADFAKLVDHLNNPNGPIHKRLDE